LRKKLLIVQTKKVNHLPPHEEHRRVLSPSC